MRFSECKLPMGLPGVLLLLCCTVTGIGCGEAGAPSRGVRVGGSGMVTLDDQPVPMARIVFLVDQGNGLVKASAMIKDGIFEFTTESGPLEGTARVEIHPVDIDLEDFEAQRASNPGARVELTRFGIPREYNVDSKLTAEVSAVDGITPLTFELKSK